MTFSLEQTQLAGACYSFGAPLDLEFIKDDPTVPLNRTQGEEQPLANLTIRKSLGNESQYFQLALAERLDEALQRRGLQRRGGYLRRTAGAIIGERRLARASLLLSFKCCQ